ncbi:hypothetical protein JQS43_16200 [Natronosporangium hydrolyticum]|uniref:DivIVA domain-containing protein n=1 Tax=Natronosporangium hydrolyticum TaxID=2811111 RepID=A0A895Y731_9ACTN|nr:hypothetical protein [Natronosporangium hydrolyticum]QSB13171.1 hypothetical protein JQS43_16200 [Natronosporangium hydrolyticum]
MRTRKRKQGRTIVPDFDVSLWGYDRHQVERCLHDLTRRLDDALTRLDSVGVLQRELCDAQIELDQLRQQMAREPHWSYRLTEIMHTAEQLREAAERAEYPREGEQPAADDHRRSPAGASAT